MRDQAGGGVGPGAREGTGGGQSLRQHLHNHAAERAHVDFGMCEARLELAMVVVVVARGCGGRVIYRIAGQAIDCDEKMTASGDIGHLASCHRCVGSVSSGGGSGDADDGDGCMSWLDVTVVGGLVGRAQLVGHLIQLDVFIRHSHFSLRRHATATPVCAFVRS